MRPRTVLSNRKMVALLTDMHYTEGVIQAAGFNYGHDEAVNGYYAAVLEKHGVTQAEFDSSLVWYTAHPQFFQRVYPKVMRNLQHRYDTETERLTQLDEELKQALADSLARQAKDAAFQKKTLTFQEMENEVLHGLSAELYHPLPPLLLFTDSIRAAMEAEKLLENDSIVALSQEKCTSLEENCEKTCENEEKAVILQSDSCKNVSFSEKRRIMPHRKPI